MTPPYILVIVTLKPEQRIDDNAWRLTFDGKQLETTQQQYSFSVGVGVGEGLINAVRRAESMINFDEIKSFGVSLW